MLSSKKLFELVINNNYDKLENAIQNKQVDFKAQNRKSEYILSIAIKYRSNECFELLANNISDEILQDYNSSQSGLFQAIEYFKNAPNLKNKYFIEKLLNKNAKIDEGNIHQITNNFAIFNEFSNYILNENPTKYLYSIYEDPNIYEIIFNHCLNNNLLNENIIKKILSMLFINYGNKENIIILIKNTHFINNIFTYYPNIIEDIYNKKYSKSLLIFFVNLYNTNVNNKSITEIFKNILIFFNCNIYGQLYYHVRYNKKEMINHLEKIDILLTLNNINNDLSTLINSKINILLKYWINKFISDLRFRTENNEEILSFYITILIHIIEKIPNFTLKLDYENFNYIKNKIEPHKQLLKGLLLLYNNLKNLTDFELNFIKKYTDEEPLKVFNFKVNEISTKTKKKYNKKKDNEIVLTI